MAVDDRIEDEELEPTEQPERAWGALDDELEIVDEEDVEPEEDDSPSVEELKAKLAQYEGQSNSTNDQLASSLSELGSTLKELRSQPANTQAQEQQVQESIDQVRKRLSDKYYDAPLETVDEYVKAMLKQELGPYLGQMAQQLNETRKSFTKTQVQQDETGQLVLEKYGDEVEKLVTGQNLDYQTAVKRVSADHLDEIITLKVEKAIEKAAASENDDDQKPKNQNPARGRGTRPPSGPKKITMARRVRETLESKAVQRGIEPKAYIAWLEKNDPEQLKGGK